MISDQEIHLVEHEIKTMWSKIDNIIPDQKKIDYLSVISEYLDCDNAIELSYRYKSMPPNTLMLINYLFQIAACEFFSKALSKKQLEQIYGEN